VAGNGEAPTQLRSWVASQLRSDILDGRLKPGEWLRQERLAQEHGVSQMPVREALKQLAAEGLVEHVPYRGVRVVQFSQDDIEDLYTCRAFVEGMAARYAAERIAPEQLAELRALHHRMREIVEPEHLAEYRELNRRFHEVIFQASGRTYLRRSLAQLWSAFPTMLWNNFAQTAAASPPGREVSDTSEHEEIVAALEAGDGERAERALRRHVEVSGRVLIDALAGQQELAAAEER
jgi:DNA-binding GntR family transcriptional regulator